MALKIYNLLTEVIYSEAMSFAIIGIDLLLLPYNRAIIVKYCLVVESGRIFRQFGMTLGMCLVVLCLSYVTWTMGSIIYQVEMRDV